ncbi:hypothetical protein KAU11_08350 [Candidatus Babeliales bacterium]|nr:hypothetical protein [Candidatus Babeliales bacterium]
MKTKLYKFYADNGAVVRMIAPDTIEFPSFQLEYYKTISRCGAGEGIGDTLVPETIWGLTVTLACYIHDYMWELADATWTDFHYSNSVFLSNIITLVTELSHPTRVNVLKNIRLYRSVTYYSAVDTFGADIFWLSKEV